VKKGTPRVKDDGRNSEEIEFEDLYGKNEMPKKRTDEKGAGETLPRAQPPAKTKWIDWNRAGGGGWKRKGGKKAVDHDGGVERLVRHGFPKTENGIGGNALRRRAAAGKGSRKITGLPK